MAWNHYGDRPRHGRFSPRLICGNVGISPETSMITITSTAVLT
ncbi:MAG: hypothetical protein ACKO5P_07825 [Nodosilinea sp.]|nr:hypothetical protein [Cyanobacteriota bacterium]